MADKKLSLGQAIDQIIAALEPLDENSRKTALSAVCSQIQITLPSTGSVTADDRLKEHRGEEKTNQNKPPKKQEKTLQVDIRSFKDEKNPNSARQMACVVAYYLQELAPKEDQKGSICKTDLEKYFKHAKYPMPKTIQQILPDAKKSGYFDSAGSGSYKLNAVGYNLVVHNLPSEQSGN